MTDEVGRVRVVVEGSSPGVEEVRAVLDPVAVFTGRVVEIDVSAVRDLSAEAVGLLLRGTLGSGGARAVVVQGATEAVESVLRSSADDLGLSSRLLVL